MEAPFLLEEVSDKTGRWGVENGTSNQQHKASNRRQQGKAQLTTRHEHKKGRDNEYDIRSNENNGIEDENKE